MSISPHEHDRLQQALDNLTDALEAHLRAATMADTIADRGADDVAMQAAYTALRHAAEAYDDLLFDATDEVTPWEFPESPHVDVEYEDKESVPSTIGVLVRRDYELVDADSLVDSGREAYHDLYPDHPEETAITDVSHPGRALFQMLHAYGIDGLDQRAEDSGLLPRGGTVWVQALDDDDVESLVEDPFGVADEEMLVYRLDEVIDRTVENLLGD